MRIMENLTERALAFFTTLVVAVQFASLANCCQTDTGKSCDDRWCCEQDVNSMCLGLSEDRLNYTVECKSPGVVEVSWEVTHSTRKDDLVVNTQYSCYNSTSNTVSSWILSDHSTSLSDHIELCNVNLGNDVSCTFSGCTNGAKVGRFSCFDYIDKEDEVTIDSSCFEDGVNNVHSSSTSSMQMTLTPLFQSPVSSLSNVDSSVLIASVSSALPSVTIIPAQQNKRLALMSVILPCGLACFGLGAGLSLILAYYLCSKKSKLGKQLQVFTSSTLPPSSKHVAQLAFLSAQPSVTGCTERKFNIKSPLQASAIDCGDNPPPHRNMTISGSTLDPVHVKCDYGQSVAAFDYGDSVSDPSTLVLQVGGDGYSMAQLPDQQLECSAE